MVDRIDPGSVPAHGAAGQDETVHAQRIGKRRDDIAKAGHIHLLETEAAREPMAGQVERDQAILVAQSAHPGLPGVQ